VCPTVSHPQDTRLTSARAAEARRTIVAWLECEECSSGELTAVLRLKERAVPTLVATLRDGPAPAKREQYRRHLVATYAAVTANEAAAGRKLGLTEDQYVRTYEENYLALYRVRSATALGAIGGPQAKAALENAAAMSYRDDVRRAIAD